MESSSLKQMIINLESGGMAMTPKEAYRYAVVRLGADKEMALQIFDELEQGQEVRSFAEQLGPTQIEKEKKAFYQERMEWARQSVRNDGSADMKKFVRQMDSLLEKEDYKNDVKNYLEPESASIVLSNDGYIINTDRPVTAQNQKQYSEYMSERNTGERRNVGAGNSPEEKRQNNREEEERERKKRYY